MIGTGMTLSVGELIDQLERAGDTDPDGGLTRVVFDFARCVPSRCGSWRGDYSELALEWRDMGRAGQDATVAVLLDRLRAAACGTFEGWKGGSFDMDRSTPIWVDNQGESTGTAIRCAERVGEFGPVVIRTEHVDL